MSNNNNNLDNIVLRIVRNKEINYTNKYIQLISEIGAAFIIDEAYEKVTNKNPTTLAQHNLECFSGALIVGVGYNWNF